METERKVKNKMQDLNRRLLISLQKKNKKIKKMMIKKMMTEKRKMKKREKTIQNNKIIPLSRYKKVKMRIVCANVVSLLLKD